MDSSVITVAIPTYNQSRTIQRAVDSVLSQTYPYIEIAINDDSDSDDYSTVIKKYAHLPNVTYRKNAKRLGLVANYRRGLQEAVGEYFLNLDGDDYLSDSTFITKAVRLLQAHKTVVMVIGGQSIMHGERGHLRQQRITREEFRVECGNSFFIRCVSDDAPVLPHLATIVSTPKARAIGYYTADLINTDLESVRRLMLHGDVILINNLCGVWVQSDTNTSLSFDPARHSTNIDCLLGPYCYAKRLGLLRADDLARLEIAIATGVKKYIRDSYAICLRTDRPLQSVFAFDRCLRTAKGDSVIVRRSLGIWRHPSILRNLAIRLLLGSRGYIALGFAKAHILARFTAASWAI